VAATPRAAGGHTPAGAGAPPPATPLPGRPQRGPAERGARPEATMSAHFSPIIIVVMHGSTGGRNGITDASATRNPVTPLTRGCGSRGDRESPGAPIRAVPAGW
jgi:hypothetical protein